MIAAPVVSPRVHSSTAEGKVLLTDEIELIMSSRDRAVIRLDGVGKSTAIQFLRNWFAGAPELYFDDQPSTLPLDLSDFQAFVITTRPSVKADVVLPLAGWDKDEVIDYLLVKNPTACQPVLSRLEESSYQFCDGSPEVWTYILEQMMADNQRNSLGEIALELLKAAIAEASMHVADNQTVPFEFRSIPSIHARLFIELTTRPVEDALTTIQIIVGNAKVPRLLSHPEIRNRFIGDEISRRLRQNDTSALSFVVPPEALAICARGIQNSAPALLVVRAAFQQNRFAAIAASLLLMCDANWNPKKLSKRSLMKAHLDGARWDGIKLLGCSLAMASFRYCQLRKGILRESSLVGANFAESDLSGADLVKVKANHANFSKCIMSGIMAADSSWPNAFLLHANLDEAKLTSADFDNAVLIDASLVRCDLSRASFYRALLDRTDFSFANCLGADFCHCDLRTAIFFESNCSHVRFDESNLEEVDLHSIDMSSASCHKTLFSGSRMRKANLQGAILHGARMAEIDWEECDLRRASLRFCDFHYGSTRCGLVDSPYPSHGTRTGFYTDDYNDRHFRKPEEIRKANLRGCDLRGAKIDGTDFYLVDLRDAKLDNSQRKQLAAAGAILD